MIIIRDNIVQRRFADRVIWDRLFVDSPVYSGDLIRAADLSAATIDVENNHLNLNENTLIRIQNSADGRGPFEVDLQKGNLSLATATEGTGITLNLMGRQVQAGAGSVLNAETGDEGIIVQVNTGTATFIEEGGVRELTEGTMIAQDPDGAERIIPAAVVTNPRPGARYIKNQPEPLSLNFAWKSINLEAGESLRLEIAADRNYTRNVQIVENVNNQAQAFFETGLWHWRLTWGNVVLSTGQLTVADATGPEPLSPAMNSLFRYQNDLPQVRLQWSEKTGTDHYVLEISGEQNFIDPVKRQSSAASFILSDLGSGIWYWRVLPVFSSAYEGSAAYSAAASFRIEQSSDPTAPSIELPEPAPQPAPARVVAVPGRNYIVQEGDNLSRIAVQAYGTADGMVQIIAANNIADANLIFVGQVIFIP
jgi:hypothetical protein